MHVLIHIRQKREFLKYDIDKLLEERGVLSSSLMPVADTTSRSLINNRNNKPTPTFPSFLPLEIFDDTEYDCRTPQEWIELGELLVGGIYLITEC